MRQRADQLPEEEAPSRDADRVVDVVLEVPGALERGVAVGQQRKVRVGAVAEPLERYLEVEQPVRDRAAREDREPDRDQRPAGEAPAEAAADGREEEQDRQARISRNAVESRETRSGYAMERRTGYAAAAGVSSVVIITPR